MFVDIVANGSIHKGMPHKFYHGRTGRVFDISPNSIGVIVNKQVRNRIVEKRIHVRVEHLRISTCNANFKKHVKEEEHRNRDNPKEKKITLNLCFFPNKFLFSYIAVFLSIFLSFFLSLPPLFSSK